MDPDRMKEAYQRLEALDDRLSYKIRPKGGFTQPTVDQVNAHLGEVSTYVLELKNIMRELMLAFASRKKPVPQGVQPPQQPPS